MAATWCLITLGFVACTDSATATAADADTPSRSTTPHPLEPSGLTPAPETAPTQDPPDPGREPAPLALDAALEPAPLLPMGPPKPQPRTFTAAFTGDMLLHTRVNRIANELGAADPDDGFDYDYRPMLEPIRPWLEAVDWAVCHMEVPLSADNTRLESYPTFRAPGDIAASAHAVGYDSCTTASNHILDQGPNGVHETLEVLDGAGLHSTGGARTPEEAESQVWLDLGGIRVAHLSYTFSFNGFRLPGDAPWMSNLIDLETILDDAAAVRRDGAEYVMVSLHWGNEYVHAPNYQQRELGPAILASPDVDIIIGHHAHVVQPIDRVDDKWLVYGLGNLLSNMSQARRRDELLVTITVEEASDGTFATSLEALPLYMDHRDMTVYPTDPALRLPGISEALNQELDASWSRVRAVLDDGSAWDALDLPPVS